MPARSVFESQRTLPTHRSRGRIWCIEKMTDGDMAAARKIKAGIEMLANAKNKYVNALLALSRLIL